MRNIVLIQPEDCGRDLEPTREADARSAIGRLARESLRFRHAFCESPLCSPSRAAMLTGTPSYQNGMFTVAHRGYDLHEPSRHLAAFLAGHGYDTVLAGQQHESDNGTRGHSREEDAKAILGYTRVLAGESDPVDTAYDHERTRVDLANARAAARFLREPREGPFFLSVGLWNAHRGFPDGRAHGEEPDHERPPGPVPDTPAAREALAGYRVLLGAVDRCVGMIMDALAESGRLEDTLVVLTVDHGPAFRGMKTTLYDPGTSVSLLMRFPEGFRAGETTDALVSQLDLFPTLCDYLGLEAPTWLVGGSLMPIARGERDTGSEAVFTSHHYATPSLDRYDLKRAVRTDRYKLIRLLPDPAASDPDEPLSPGPFLDRADGKEWPEAERRLHGRAHGELLFDLVLDPMERIDVSDRPAYAAARADLRGRLADWLARTDDPALRGAVPAPPATQRAS